MVKLTDGGVREVQEGKRIDDLVARVRSSADRGMSVAASSTWAGIPPT